MRHVSLFQVDLGDGVKPSGFYVLSNNGLFPAPLPQDGADIERVEKLFHTLGIFVAKAVQDGRLVDIPLCRSFLKMMCRGEVGSHITQQFSELVHSESEVFSEPEWQKVRPATMTSCAWYSGVLNFDDLEQIQPLTARFLKQCHELANRKRALDSDDGTAPLIGCGTGAHAQHRRDRTLELETGNGQTVRLEDLG